MRNFPLALTEFLVVCLLMAALLLTGCATVRVQPWERDVLARPEMSADYGQVPRGIDEHIYFSKEAASGGRGYGGGGCGCN